MTLPLCLVFLLWISAMFSADEDQRRATARRGSL
jgi:hypothetical protein